MDDFLGVYPDWDESGAGITTHFNGRKYTYFPMSNRLWHSGPNDTFFPLRKLTPEEAQYIKENLPEFLLMERL